MNISIVLTTFNRPYQLLETLKSIDEQTTGCQIVVVDDGTDDRTRGISLAFDALYLKLRRPESEHYRNQARPLNVGIRHALGETIILQNAEVKHVGGNVIQQLTERVTDSNAVFAHVTSMNEDGTRGMCYCGPENPRPYFFCGAIKRINLMRLRGFDEDYQGYGYEDDDMADRLRRSGITFEFSNVQVEHQWHPPAGIIDASMTAGITMFREKQQEGVREESGERMGGAVSDRPNAFIQWKGTNVCMDCYCLCGEQFHVDDDFCYAVKCPHCGKLFSMGSHVEMTQMTDEESAEWIRQQSPVSEGQP